MVFLVYVLCLKAAPKSVKESLNLHANGLREEMPTGS